MLIINPSLLYNLLFLNFLILFISLYSFLFLASNYIYIIICNELMLYGMILQFLLYGMYQFEILCSIFVLFIILISSAEVVIVFSVIVLSYRLTSSISIELQYCV